MRKVSIPAHYQPQYKSVGNQGSSAHVLPELLVERPCTLRGGMGTCRGEENDEKFLKSVPCKSFHLLCCVGLASGAKLCT